MVQKSTLCAWENSIEIMSRTIKSLTLKTARSSRLLHSLSFRTLNPLTSRSMLGLLVKGRSQGRSSGTVICRERSGQTTMKSFRGLWRILQVYPSICDMLNGLPENLPKRTCPYDRRQRAPSSSHLGWLISDTLAPAQSACWASSQL